MNTATEVEVWVELPIWKGYEVSSLGNVRGKARTITTANGKERKIPSRTLRPYKNKDGYQYVSLSVCGVGWSRQVSELVMLAFEGERPEGCEVHHINKKRCDNRRSNLAYVDGKQHLEEHFRGERNPNAKLSDAAILKARQLYAE